MTDTPTKLEPTHISIILDRSGSMSSCAAEAISAVNAYLAEARKDDVLKEADLELTIFDSQSIDTIRAGAPIAIADLTAEDFKPRGGTPLYDAIGKGIDSLEERTGKSGSKKAILVVMTDGEENMSQRFPGEQGRQQLQAILKECQDRGWLVIFLGAGINNALQGTALGVRAASTASIGTDAKALRSVAGSTYAMSAAYAAAPNVMEFMESSESAFSAEARTNMGDATGGAAIVGRPQDQSNAPVGAARVNIGKVGLKPVPADNKPQDAWTKPKVDAWATKN